MGAPFAISLQSGVVSQSPRGAELGLHTGTVLEAIRMQFFGRGMLSGVFVLGACAGGGEGYIKTDSTSVMSGATTT